MSVLVDTITAYATDALDDEPTGTSADKADVLDRVIESLRWHAATLRGYDRPETLAPVDPRAAAAVELVERMAGWVLDGEPATPELRDHVEEKVDNDGNYMLDGEEASATVHAWVEEAREIVAERAAEDGMGNPVGHDHGPQDSTSGDGSEAGEPTTPAPRIETVIMRDSDSGLDVFTYLDGKDVTRTAEVSIVDNGGADLSDPEQLEEWLNDRREDAKTASPAAAATILTLAGNEADARGYVEHVHYCVDAKKDAPNGDATAYITSYNQTRDQLHADVADFRAEGCTISRLYAARVEGKPEECECGSTEPSSAFAEGHSVGYYATRPAKYDNPWQQAEYERGVAFGEARYDRENSALSH